MPRKQVKLGIPCPARRATDTSVKKSAPSIGSMSCHLNWVSSYAISEATTRILRDSLATCPDLNSETSNGSNVITSERINHIMWRAVFEYMDKDGDAAQDTLKAAREVLCSLESGFGQLSTEHIKCFQYLVHANRAVLFLQRGDDKSAAEAKKEALGIDVKDAKTKGVMLTIKGAFLGFLGDREAHAEHLREALKSDTHVPEYSEGLFYALRKIRKERDPFAGPTEEEISLLEKSYAQAPSKFYACNSMTVLYQDILNAKFHNVKYNCPPLSEFGVEGLVSKIKALARRAWSLKPSSVEAGLRLAEILLYDEYGRIPNRYHINKSDKEEAKEQYKALEKLWPDNSDVLHGIGKFYCMFPDPALEGEGMRYLKLSLVAEPCNLLALTDYFRYSHPYPASQSPERAKECMMRINASLMACKGKTHLISKLFCWMATLLCKEHKFDEALDIWFDAVEMNADLLHSNVFSIFGKGVFNGLFDSSDYKLLFSFLCEASQRITIESHVNILTRLIDEI